MRISYNWLHRYLDAVPTPDRLEQVLTRIGLEVESRENLGERFDGFVVGEVSAVQKHPNADRLSVCMVKIAPGRPPHQIVCGAPNVAAGQRVIVGLPGAVVPQNQHDPEKKPFQLSKATIRGVESNGMICSEYELGLGDDKSGIKVLTDNPRIGTSLSEYLHVNDTAFELGITPNRPDCLGHIGVARDIAAALGKNLRYPKISLKPASPTALKKMIEVSVKNTAGCPRYTVRIIRNINVGESPAWLKALLASAGIRSVNSVVDVTNFIMLEYGQPLHAFDYSAIAGRKIVVQNSIPGQTFVTLDKREHTLDGSELMICDSDRPIAFAGIMGGLNSEITDATTTVALESAYFSPSTIRKAARRHGFNTDASYRFERGTDPNIPDIASARAAEMIVQFCGGEIVPGCVDVYPRMIKPRTVDLRLHRVNDILGTDIDAKTVRSILTSLEFRVVKGAKSGTLRCVVPTFRPDVEQEIDLIEEIARLYGYDNIPDTVSGSSQPLVKDASEERIVEIRSWCEANGFNEIITNSLIDRTLITGNDAELLKVKNPLGSDHEYLRPSLLPTMLQSVAYNINHGATRIQFFEIGSIFRRVSDGKARFVEGYYEQNTLGICLSGFANALHWTEKRRSWDIFDIKGITESLLNHLGLDNIHLICYDEPSSLTESAIRIEINGTYVGSVGKCPVEILEKFKIEGDVYYSELDLDTIVKYRPSRTHAGISKFPSVSRDVAFIVRQDIPVGAMDETIRKSGGSIVTGVTLFDVFVGKAIGEGKKSVAFSLTMNSPDKTLTDNEIDDVVSRIVASITSTFDAALRSL